MNPCLTRRAALLAAAFSLAAAALPSRAAGATYQFSPVNQYGIQVTAAYWNPIIDYVSEKSGVQLRLKIGRTSADTTAYVLAQEVDFVFSNHLFSPEREQLGWRVFGRRQTPPIHAQIIVPADSPIKELAQLEGKDVAPAAPAASAASASRSASVAAVACRPSKLARPGARATAWASTSRADARSPRSCSARPRRPKASACWNGPWACATPAR